MSENLTEKQKALQLCKGCYQINLVRGQETLGGSTLRGKAATYRGRYGASANNLVARLKEAGIKFEIEPGPRGGWHSATLKFS